MTTPKCWVCAAHVCHCGRRCLLAPSVDVEHWATIRRIPYRLRRSEGRLGSRARTPQWGRRRAQGRASIPNNQRRSDVDTACGDRHPKHAAPGGCTHGNGQLRERQRRLGTTGDDRSEGAITANHRWRRPLERRGDQYRRLNVGYAPRCSYDVAFFRRGRDIKWRRHAPQNGGNGDRCRRIGFLRCSARSSLLAHVDDSQPTGDRRRYLSRRRRDECTQQRGVRWLGRPTHNPNRARKRGAAGSLYMSAAPLCGPSGSPACRRPLPEHSRRRRCARGLRRALRHRRTSAGT